MNGFQEKQESLSVQNANLLIGILRKKIKADYQREYIKKNKKKVRACCRKWERKNAEKRRRMAHRVSLTCVFCHKKYLGFRKSQKSCSRICMGLSKRRNDLNAYLHKRATTHPNVHRNGSLPAHRFIMSQFLGRPLTKKEVVHHIDKNKRNNNIENLILFPSSSEHAALHNKERHK